MHLASPHIEPLLPRARPTSPSGARSTAAATKTLRSRRTLRIPLFALFAADALRELQQRQRRHTGPVFATRDGNPLDAANVRREFRAAVHSAAIPGTRTPRELRHTFVSLMSDSGVPVEEIARLASHTTSRTTELGYRHQLRRLMETGAQTLDQLFPRTA